MQQPVYDAIIVGSGAGRSMAAKVFSLAGRPATASKRSAIVVQAKTQAVSSATGLPSVTLMSGAVSGPYA